MKKWENKNLSLEERAKYFVKDMSREDKADEIARVVSSIPVLDIFKSTADDIYKEEIVDRICSAFPPISCIGAMFGNELSYDAAYYYINYAIDKKIINEKTLDSIIYKIIYHKINSGNAMLEKHTRSRTREKRNAFDKGEQMIAESTVLLKNNGLLPLSKDKVGSIAIIGPNANCTEVLTGEPDGSDTNTVFHGLLEAYPSVKILYAKGCGYSRELDEKEAYEAVKVAEQAEIIVLALGLTPEMEGKAKGKETVWSLPKSQIELMEKIHRMGKPIVLLNFSGACVDLGRADKICDAIMQCWYPYKKTDETVSKLLFNDYQPTGKLPFTFYRNADTTEESAKKNKEILYPFGYGLNYSNIEYYRIYLSSASIEAGEDIVVTIYAKNKGKYSTKDTVQVYLVDEQASIKVPEMKLAASKLVELPKDKEVKISLRIRAEDMATTKEDGTIVIEPGRFSMYVGSGQPDDLTAELYNRDCLHIGFLVE